jgi:nucleotide-binding universal stress UspA family protein
MAREIIIGDDGTPRGEDALALARAFAEGLDASSLIRVTVGNPEAPAVVASGAAEEDDLGGTAVVERALSDDSPARALHALAEAEDPLLIVLGSTHRGPLGRVFIGSVGEALLSGAPCAIAVAPRNYAAGGERRLLRIGVGVDGSPESLEALDAGIALADRLNASFTLVAVGAPRGQSVGATSAVPVPDQGTLRREVMVKALDDATDRVPTDLPVARRLLRGAPADQLAKAGEDFDLLILGSRGYGPVRSVLLGGVSAKLMRTSPCPVLVLPRGAGGDPLHVAEKQS